MKTPREILFERHQGAEAKLDAVREKLLAELAVRNQGDARVSESAFKLVLRRWL